MHTFIGKFQEKIRIKFVGKSTEKLLEEFLGDIQKKQKLEQLHKKDIRISLESFWSSQRNSLGYLGGVLAVIST